MPVEGWVWKPPPPKAASPGYRIVSAKWAGMNRSVAPSNASSRAAPVQCASENATRDMLSLWENVRVEMGGARPYQYNSDSSNNDIDTTAEVHPIQVSAGSYA
ncbi:MAG: hypothetical protein JWP15_3148, partial [Alphaproteobacteria bacterium]|nr:hypothetical protein [Alphaproteobacteria bacterium]